MSPSFPRFAYALMVATLLSACASQSADVADEDGTDDVTASSEASVVSSGPRDMMIHAKPPAGWRTMAEKVPVAPRAIFLNREEKTYTGGDADDSATGVSAIVKYGGKTSATIKRLSWSDAKWEEFKDCVADEYARFNIKVTDTRPEAGDGPYIEASIGGKGKEVGMPFGVLGVAMVDTDYCQPIPNAIVFVFAANLMSGSAQTNCETAAQEISHALVPLDHEMLASDPMTYLSYSGHKTFQDVDAQCGESGNRACMCGRERQNSVKLITATVGAAGCTPDCTGRTCGSDGCGGTCGEACAAGQACDATGQCSACTPQCSDKVCGPDGCGGICGMCGSDEGCDNGKCTKG